MKLLLTTALLILTSWALWGACSWRCCAAPQPSQPPTSIGTATLAEDGTLTLRLITGAGGARAEGVVTYPPDHPNYAEVRRHVDPIRPGEVVQVRPWPDEAPIAPQP